MPEHSHWLPTAYQRRVYGCTGWWPRRRRGAFAWGTVTWTAHEVVLEPFAGEPLHFDLRGGVSVRDVALLAMGAGIGPATSDVVSLEPEP